MLIKIISIATALIAHGILSRILFYIFRKKTLVSVILLNLVSFAIIVCIMAFALKDIFNIEDIFHSILLFIAPLLIWTTIDLIKLPVSNDKRIKIFNSDFSLISSIVLVSLIVSLLNIINYPTKQQRAANQFIDDVNALINNTNEFNKRPNDDVALLDENPILEGDAGEQERYLREILNSSASLRLEYQQELHDADVHLLLEPSRLRGTLNLANTKKIQSDALDIIGKFQSKNLQLLDIAKTKFENLNINERDKELARYEFNKHLSKSKDKLNTLWEMEKLAINKTAGIATWLGENNDGWLYQNEQFLFYSDADIEYFNNQITELNDIFIKQTEQQEENQNKLNATIKSLK